MKTLSRVRDGAPRELANAVLVSPDDMFRYVDYALDAVEDPHSDSFEKYVLKVSRCEPLALPEAD